MHVFVQEELLTQLLETHKDYDDINSAVIEVRAGKRDRGERDMIRVWYYQVQGDWRLHFLQQKCFKCTKSTLFIIKLLH